MVCALLLRMVFLLFLCAELIRLTRVTKTNSGGMLKKKYGTLLGKWRESIKQIKGVWNSRNTWIFFCFFQKQIKRKKSFKNKRKAIGQPKTRTLTERTESNEKKTKTKCIID